MGEWEAQQESRTGVMGLIIIPATKGLPLSLLSVFGESLQVFQQTHDMI